MPARPRPRPLRSAALVVGATAALFLALAIPGPAPAVSPAPAGARAFTWNRDSVWRALETSFVRARATGCPGQPGAAAALATLGRTIEGLRHSRLAATAALLDTVELRFFDLGPTVAACPERMTDYVTLFGRMREAVKWQSRQWDLDGRDARDRLYRALYGGRAAVEEVMLQHPGRIAPLLLGSSVPSATPAAVAHGVTLHSGDIVVSRGGYPTSALIARGSDYPGNFSHIALVHVDETSHAISVIEAHIESGVAISSFERYLADKKLRLMLLRPRPDLPALQRDPLLPHRAATAMLTRARTTHIPYDFTMDYTDPARLFCSEVASAPYHDQGLDLWMGISTISGEGLRRWLASFGVRHFATQEPSDLEYDPQLAIVAEWRDAASLAGDHLDNAVTDVMLEGAERGERLRFPWYALPPARLAKAYSWLRERAGGVGPVPEGMGAAAALRSRAYTERHRSLAFRVRAAAAEWKAAHGYEPAYWTLVDLARQAAAAPDD